MRRAGAAILAVALVAGALAALVAFLGGRDESTFDSDAGEAGPGQAFPDQGSRHLRAGEDRPRYGSDPPTSGPHAPRAVARDDVALDTDQRLHALELGNVVLSYGDSRLAPALRALARDVAGPFSSALAAAGQAVILDRRRSTGGQGVTASAWRHLLRVASPSDPELRRFVEFWLGRGAAPG
jgi:hypothetical protein